MITARAWLEERLAADAPPALLDRMVSALPADGGSVADALMQGALDLYRTVAASTGGREDALPLLAADALFTHAFEAQAEEDPGRIGELALRGERLLGEILA